MRDWLRTIGLEQYASLFLENEVDLDTLQVLTESDLQELGLPFGPRKRLLNALLELKRQESRSPDETVTAALHPASAGSSPSSSATWSDLPIWRAGSIPRSFKPSFTATKTCARPAFPATRATCSSGSETASSPSLDFRLRTRARRSGPFTRRGRSSRCWRRWISRGWAVCGCGPGLQPAW
jgi:hypothetical protein